MAFFFASCVYADGAAGLAIEVAKRQAFVLRTDHLICLVIMGEEFGAIDASSFCFGSLQATIPEAPEEFNVSFMDGDHTLLTNEYDGRRVLPKTFFMLWILTKTTQKRRVMGRTVTPANSTSEDYCSERTSLRIGPSLPSERNPTGTGKMAKT